MGIISIREVNDMTFLDVLNNKYQNIKLNIVKYAYVYIPVASVLIVFTSFRNNPVDYEFISNAINLSGILAGFLFTSLGIMISLPDNKFTAQLTINGYMGIIFKTMAIGIVAFLISMVMGLLKFNTSIMSLFFTVGVSETFLSSYYLFQVSKYSGKSK